MSANSDKLRYLPLGVASGIAVVIVVFFAWLARWRGLPFSIDPRNLLNVMAPLLLTAGFVERSVEVIISPWRDAGATKLTRALAALQASSGAVPAAPAAGQIKILSEELADYKGKTQRYAFAVSITLSLAAACVGVRSLWPLLDMKARSGFDQADPAQQGTFLVFDVILSAALLAGGADGIHAVINSFTTFFNTTAQKAQQSANAPS